MKILYKIKFLLILLALYFLSGCSLIHQEEQINQELQEKPTPIEQKIQNEYQDTLITNYDIKPKNNETPELNLWEYAIFHMNFSIPKHSKNNKYIKIITKNKTTLKRQLNSGHLFLFYIINELKARDMPLELAIIPIIESNYNPYAISPTGAKGLWQFTRGTGKIFKLYETKTYSYRRDTVALTTAALDYFQYLYNRFKDWSIAIAAYNVGEGTVAKAIKQNKARNLPTDLSHLKIPRTGKEYVDKLYAYTEILRNPKTYDIEFPNMPYKPVFKKVKLNGRNLIEVSKDYKISVNRLQKLNPGFKNEKVRNKDIEFILVPLNNNDILENYVIKNTAQPQENNNKNGK